MPELAGQSCGTLNQLMIEDQARPNSSETVIAIRFATP
jgi:hypothetical protein